MPERQTGNQVTQIGIETTSGTSVAANKRLKSVDITLNTAGEFTSFVPQGSRLATTVVPGREWTSGSISGMPVYDEIIYPLAIALGAPVTTTVLTTGKQHVFTLLNNGAAQAAKTVTLEKGDAVRAGKASHVQAETLGFSISRSEFSIEGDVMGQLYTDGVTLTATPATFPQIPILPKDFSVYLDNTWAALGTTKLLRGFASNISLSGLIAGVWPLNQANTSFATTVDTTELDATMELRMAADAVGMAQLTALRAGTTKYLRIEALGPLIAGGTAVNTFRIDAAVKFADYAEFDDEDGIYVVPWPLQVVDDASGPLVITVINQVAAL